MTRVLLTGGSGFIAAHVLDVLLEHGHSVVTTVRTQEKADKIREAHPKFGKDKLDFAIVPDIADPAAFEEAVKSTPVRSGGPYCVSVSFQCHRRSEGAPRSAVKGTKGVLAAIKKSAPAVTRVVITSSFAAIVDAQRGTGPDITYSEKDWNPITPAWDFVEKENPHFSISTINPPLVFGPIVHYLNSLEGLNTSNQRIRNAINGSFKEEIAPTGVHTWVDVRDVALAHVKAMEIPDAANKRFYVVAGKFSNRKIVEIARENFPEYEDKLPAESVKGGDYPEGSEENVMKSDNRRSINLLGLQYRKFEDTIVDTIKSLKNVGAQGWN